MSHLNVGFCVQDDQYNSINIFHNFVANERNIFLVFMNGPLLCGGFWLRSLKTLISYTTPYGSKSSRSCSSDQDRGICPTNIFIASTSGWSGWSKDPFIFFPLLKKKKSHHGKSREALSPIMGQTHWFWSITHLTLFTVFWRRFLWRLEGSTSDEKQNFNTEHKTPPGCMLKIPYVKCSLGQVC